MNKNRFFKSTPGVDAEVFVGKAVEYTTDTTLADFQANAVEGELALINAGTNAVLTSTPAAGTQIFIALKRDGRVERSAPFVLSQAVVDKIAYIAPVKHKITITSTGSKAILSDVDGGGVSVYAREAGTAGNSLQIEYIDSASNNVPLTVTATATKVTVNLATDGSSAPTSTAAQVAAAINASAAASALMTAVVTGTASTVQSAFTAANLAGGTAEPVVAAKDSLELVIIETTPQLETMPRWNYGVQVKAGETFSDAIDRLIAKINDSTAPENVNKTQIVTAAWVYDDVNAFTLEAIDYGVHFTVALRGEFETEGSSFAVTTQFKFGSGTPDQVRLAEEYGDIRKGVTTNYPDQNATPAEFGKATSFVDDANTYNAYRIIYSAETTTATLGKEFRKNHIFLYVPSNGTNPDTEIDAVI